MYDGVCSLFDFNIFSVMKAKSEELFAASHTHGYRTNFLPFAFRIFVLLFIWNRVDNSFSLLSAIKQNHAKHEFIFQNLLRHTVPGKHYKENCKFTCHGLAFILLLVTVAWIFILLLKAGDIEQNPGPQTGTSVSTANTSSLASGGSMNLSTLQNKLSIVHYNVQSITRKIDILSSELFEFDILAFSETWLNPSISKETLLIQSYREPERKDRQGNSHGGVMIYVKDSIYYKRRLDLEPRGIECIWIELVLKHKHILFGLFYRPLNSDLNYYSTMEDSIHLAVDTGINDIIITGDFNINMYNPQSARKINDFCNQFSLTQVVNEPTHFTEHSSTLIDLMLVSNPNHVILNGVGDHFLGQDLRYHCPIFGIFKFCKPIRRSFTHHIWRYEQGNYDLLKEMASSTDWKALHNLDINVYAKRLIDKILEISKDCIPNKIVTIRPSDPPWMTSSIKRYIRKRKRAYRRAKQTNFMNDWNTFRRLRNKTISMIRESKKALNESLSDKLKSDSLSPRQWWSLLKSFISPSSQASSPPLEKDGLVFVEEKVNVLNDFFRDQTLLNDHDAALPEIAPYLVERCLSSLVLSPDEVKLILKSLPVGKATGPDGQ